MGRPVKGDNSTQSYANWAKTDAMKVLLMVAARRNLDLTRFAALIKCDRKTLYNYVKSETLRPETIKRIAKALRIDPLAIVVRAFRDEMTDRDFLWAERKVMIAFHGLLDDANPRVFDFRAVPEEVRHEALRSYVLAEIDLDTGERPAAQAFADVLADHGFPIYRDALGREPWFPEHVREIVEQVQQRVDRSLTPEQVSHLSDVLASSIYVTATPSNLSDASPSTSPSEVRHEISAFVTAPRAGKQ